jgi:hypothetical protein
VVRHSGKRKRSETKSPAKIPRTRASRPFFFPWGVVPCDGFGGADGFGGVGAFAELMDFLEAELVMGDPIR